MDDNDQAVIHNLNELKKTMFSLMGRFHDTGLKVRFQHPLVELHRALSQFIIRVDEEGYLYKMKKADDNHET